MRTITIHIDADPGDALNQKLTIEADVRDPINGNASHWYNIEYGDIICTTVQFQHGPRNVAGSRPGVTDLAILSIEIDRLEGFQAGPFACPENQAALDHLRAAAAILADRGKKRREQGVIGLNVNHKS